MVRRGYGRPNMSFPLIEIVDARLQDRRYSDTVADNGAAAGIAVGGRPVGLLDVDLRSVGGIMYKNSRSRRPALPQACSAIPRSEWLARQKLAAMVSASQPGHRAGGRSPGGVRAQGRYAPCRLRPARRHRRAVRLTTRGIDAAQGLSRFAVGTSACRLPPAIRAADYPTRPGSRSWSHPRGGASRRSSSCILARKLEQIGQPIVINWPGAGGNVAAEAVAHSAPDGYTLFTGNNAILTNAALYKKINDWSPDFYHRADRFSDILAVIGAAGPVDGRAHRARESQSGQAQFRLVRPRAGGASRRRAVQGRGEDRHHPRALQGRAGPAGRDRGARADDVRHHRIGSAHIQDGKLAVLAVATSKRTAAFRHRPSTSSA